MRRFHPYRCLRAAAKTKSQRLVYRLALEDDCYYVGQTDINNLQRRITAHADGTGSMWTRLHKPLNISPGDQYIHDYILVDACIAGLVEDFETKSLMFEHDISKVRGGSYCDVELPDYKLNALKLEFVHNQGRCFKCGELGHFASACNAIMKTATCTIQDGTQDTPWDSFGKFDFKLDDARGYCIKCQQNGHTVADCAKIIAEIQPANENFVQKLCALLKLASSWTWWFLRTGCAAITCFQ